jgi:short-subunit dehydrogenase
MNYRDQYGAWALVVGASVTVGEQFARQLGAKGMNVVMVARRGERLDAIAEEIRKANGVETRTCPLDLLREGAVDELVEATRDLEIGYLVVNANLHKVNHFHLMPMEDKHNMLRMNYEMPVELTHHYGAQMVERRRGAIVHVNTLNSLSPVDIDAVFQGTKAALRIFSESLWVEYRKFNVRVGSAHVNGIEGSESYAAKMSPTSRRIVKMLGISMDPKLIVARAMKQLDRGKVILVPDNWFLTNHLVIKVADVIRLLGGKLSLLLPSALFHWVLNGEEVQATFRNAPKLRSTDQDEPP